MQFVFQHFQRTCEIYELKVWTGVTPLLSPAAPVIAITWTQRKYYWSTVKEVGRKKLSGAYFNFPSLNIVIAVEKRGCIYACGRHLHQCWYCQILCAELPMDTCRCTPRMHLLGLEQAFVLRELHSNNTSSWMPPPWQLQGSSVLSKGPTEHVEIYVHYKLYYMFMYIMHCLTWLSLFIYHKS